MFQVVPNEDSSPALQFTNPKKAEKDNKESKDKDKEKEKATKSEKLPPDAHDTPLSPKRRVTIADRKKGSRDNVMVSCVWCACVHVVLTLIARSKCTA